MSGQDMDHSGFIDRFRKGEEEAFNQVFNQFYNGIYLFVLRIVDSPADAKDITADTFMKIWLLREDYENLANIKAFLYLAARNASIDFIRFRKKKQASQKEINYLGGEDMPNMDLDMIRADFYNELSLQIEKLPPKSGMVFRMIFFNGKKTSDIAKKMGISNKTVLAHKRNAILQLRSALLKKDLIFIITFLSLLADALNGSCLSKLSSAAFFT